MSWYPREKEHPRKKAHLIKKKVFFGKGVALQEKNSKGENRKIAAQRDQTCLGSIELTSCMTLDLSEKSPKKKVKQQRSRNIYQIIYEIKE